MIWTKEYQLKLANTIAKIIFVFPYLTSHNVQCIYSQIVKNKCAFIGNSNHHRITVMSAKWCMYVMVMYHKFPTGDDATVKLLGV